ncbi:MAG: glycosyltransferase family 2 protein [Candidatus ainarchaeum sp.]|nr:glycosyltransferase family 2 protein [Candidatus ainarchaeum sp.]
MPSASVAIASRGALCKTVAVIPAFNEEARVAGVVRESSRYVDEVLVVDDGSMDATGEAAGKAGASVLRVPVNMGVGFASRIGAERAIEGMRAGAIVFIDADGQHPPELIPRLLLKIGEGWEAVFTTRSGETGNMPLVKRFGNGFLTWATNLFSGGRFTDTQTGFRAMTGEAWNRLRLESDGYEICSEIAWETAKRGIKYCEVPIPAKYDSWTRAKGTDVVTGIKIFARLLFWRVSRWT